MLKGVGWPSKLKMLMLRILPRKVGIAREDVTFVRSILMMILVLALALAGLSDLNQET